MGGLVMAALLTGCAGSGDDDEVALGYVGAKMTLAEFEAEYERRADEFPFTPETRDSVLLAFASSLVDKMVMAHEAVNHPRGDTAGLARILAQEERRIILGIIQERIYDDIDVSAAKMDEIYQWLGEEVLVQHILVESEAEAKRIKSEIAGGLAFEEAATTHSKDAFSAADGGQLDWFGYGEFLGLDDAAFALEEGEVSEPTWTRRGWHLVKLLERRPRERSQVEKEPALFENHYADKLRRQRWEEFLDTFYRSRSVTWNEEGYEVALALQTGYRDLYMNEARKFKAAEAEGIEKPDVTFFLEQRGAVPTDEQASMVIASSDGFDFTIKDAMDTMWLTSFGDRPDPREPHAYRSWLQETLTEHLLVEDARNTLLTEPKYARDVKDGVEFIQVQRLYNHEVHEQVQPSTEELQAFHEEYGEYYAHPQSLDVLVVRANGLPEANRIRDALLAGDSAETITSEFGQVEGFEITPRTGLQHAWPDLEGLDRLVRSTAPHEVGEVSSVEAVQAKPTVVRVEEVGEREPMDFESARLFVLRDCAVQQREARTLEFLAELRARYGAEIDSAVVLSADVVSPEVPADPDADHDHGATS
jgi:hypothetical protein